MNNEYVLCDDLLCIQFVIEMIIQLSRSFVKRTDKDNGKSMDKYFSLNNLIYLMKLFPEQ